MSYQIDDLVRIEGRQGYFRLKRWGPGENEATLWGPINKNGLETRSQMVTVYADELRAKRKGKP